MISGGATVSCCGEKKTPCCQNPDKDMAKPEECSAEQIKDCHGDEEGHPCTEGCCGSK